MHSYSAGIPHNSVAVGSGRDNRPVGRIRVEPVSGKKRPHSSRRAINWSGRVRWNIRYEARRAAGLLRGRVKVGSGRDAGPAICRARWADLPADPGASWHPVDMGRQAIRATDDFFTNGHFLAVGSPVGIKPTKNEWDQERADRLADESVREMYERAAPIVARGVLATELRGFDPAAEVGSSVGLLAPNPNPDHPADDEWIAVDPAYVTWFKANFPGCAFYLSDPDDPLKLVAVAHDAYAEPVGLIAGQKVRADLPADGEPCALSMPANSGIAKPSRPKSGRVGKPRQPAGEAKAISSAREWLVARIRRLADEAPEHTRLGEIRENQRRDRKPWTKPRAFPGFTGDTVIIQVGGATYRIFHDRGPLLAFAEAMESSGADLRGPVSITFMPAPQIPAEPAAEAPTLPMALPPAPEPAPEPKPLMAWVPEGTAVNGTLDHMQGVMNYLVSLGMGDEFRISPDYFISPTLGPIYHLEVLTNLPASVGSGAPVGSGRAAPTIRPRRTVGAGATVRPRRIVRPCHARSGRAGAVVKHSLTTRLAMVGSGREMATVKQSLTVRAGFGSGWRRGPPGAKIARNTRTNARTSNTGQVT